MTEKSDREDGFKIFIIDKISMGKLFNMVSHKYFSPALPVNLLLNEIGLDTRRVGGL